MSSGMLQDESELGGDTAPIIKVEGPGGQS